MILITLTYCNDLAIVKRIAMFPLFVSSFNEQDSKTATIRGEINTPEENKKLWLNLKQKRTNKWHLVAEDLSDEPQGATSQPADDRSVIEHIQKIQFLG